MKKRPLFKIAAIVYLMVSVLFLGQISAFADEVKPVHEYKFDGESNTTVIDSGRVKVDGESRGTNHENFFPGYNGKGKSRYFNGIDDTLSFNNAFYKQIGPVSFRFKIKKDASTFSSERLEPIINTGGNNFRGGYFIGIGTEKLNNRSGGRPVLTSRNGTLYILYSPYEDKISFEIQTPESVCDGQWHDILFTWDGTKTANAVKLYLDDMITPVAQATALYEEGARITFLDMGNRLNNIEGVKFESYWYNGYLDDVQIYDSVITAESSTPGSSSNLKAVGGDSKVDLTWDAVTNATSYTIKRATTAGGTYTTIATDITGTSYIDTDVTNGTTYYYVVVSVNTGVEIAKSNEASATPVKTSPSTDAKLKVVLEISEALQLSVDNDLNVNTEMAWSSSNENVAKVSGKGIVAALSPGNTVITVKSADGSYTDYINVLVVENADDYRLAIDLKVGETSRLTVDDFTNTFNVKWAPMDSSIANVTNKGKVTALSKGLVLITAKDVEGNIIGRVYVRVRE
jgi:hypothetical protein